VRRAILRTAFCADLVLAIHEILSERPMPTAALAQKILAGPCEPASRARL
jgi:hypothetical protein